MPCGRDGKGPSRAAKARLTQGILMDITKPWDLTLWDPAFFVLGLLVLAILVAFIYACDKI